MMRFIIAAVGKASGIYVGTTEEYLKRISRFAKIELIECKECGSGGSQLESLSAKEKEGAELLQKAKGYLIAFDKGGEELSSEEFADFLQKTAVQGESQFTFLIGGSDGLSPAVLSRSTKVLSFGKATFPHQLARLMVAEQVYRAMTILHHTLYHK